MTTRQPAAHSSQPTSLDWQWTRPRDKRAAQPRGWPVPAALVALSAIPLAAGSLRLVQLAGGPTVMPADDRFTGFPAAPP